MSKSSEVVARVHSVETFGTVDGPGIRYVLFLQGCPLQCQYCHNRDTWDFNGGTVRSLTDILQEIQKYTSYFRTSHGGVTVSGGEPLLQTNFCTELFRELHKQSIHTALDTAGSLPVTNEIADLLQVTDLVLLDIKQINDEKAKVLTGSSNHYNLAFARYLSDHHIPMWIRQVLIPGYTDDPNDLLALKDFLSTLSSVEKIELLPYHKMGEFKWNHLGEAYPFQKVNLPTEEEIEKAKQLLGID